MKTLDTLAADIDQLFFKGKEIDDANLDGLLANIKLLIRERLLSKPEEAPRIRMSKLGTPDRKLWYEQHVPLPRTSSSNALKFIYGDIIEQLIIFLAKEAGHTVEDEQKEFEIDGIKGHQDCKLDGVVVDIKSASAYAFRKFSERTLFKDDPFGYIAQLSSYAHANGVDEAAFVGVNKESGAICILPLQQIDLIDAPKRIEQVKVLAAPDAPKPQKKCYEPVPHNKGENLTLNKNCTYCPYAKDCWSDANDGKGLRYFKYATGILPLTKVVNMPRVEEIFPADVDGESNRANGGEITDTLGALPI